MFEYEVSYRGPLLEIVLGIGILLLLLSSLVPVAVLIVVLVLWLTMRDSSQMFLPCTLVSLLLIMRRNGFNKLT